MDYTYKVLKRNFYSFQNYSLVPIRMQDKMLIKQWRNEQMNILRQNKLLTDEEQTAYFENEVKNLFNQEYPQQILFSYLKDDELIGYGGIVHINWLDKRGEISFLLETERNKNIQQFKIDFEIYVYLIKSIAFIELNLNKIYTEVYDIRPYIIESLEKSGFLLEGRLKNHIWIENKYVDSIIHAFFKSCFSFTSDKQPSAHNSFNVLVTSISKKIPLIRAIRAATDKLDRNIKLIGGDIDDSCLGRYFVDEFWLMPRITEENKQGILEYLLAKNIKAIIPTRDGELLFWANFRKELLSQGIAVMVSPAQAVEACLDKLKFYHVLSQLRFPVIPTFDSIDAVQNTTTYVVKERYGAGSGDIGLNLSKEEAVRHAQKLSNPIFQPFLKGKEFSVDVYIDNKKQAKGAIVRSRDVIVNGESQITTTVSNEAMAKLGMEVVEAIKLYGHTILQVIEENHTFHIIECNSRFGGASTLSVSAGLDSFYWFLLEAKGVDISEYPFIKAGTEKKQIRFPADLVI